MKNSNEEIVVMAGGSNDISRDLIKSVRGSFWPRSDKKFYIIITASLIIHCGFMAYVYLKPIPKQEKIVLEDVSERFAKLIIEKPLPKIDKKAKKAAESKAAEKQKLTEKTQQKKEEIAEAETDIPKPQRVLSDKERVAARNAINKQAVAVEQKMRTVGVLGMLTGSGTTAKGAAIVDVIGATSGRKEQLMDLESALASMSGLKKTQTTDVLNQKLVRSKDVGVTHKEDITDLVSAIESSKSADLVKRGDFVIQRPESIEGAAAHSALRDNSAINKVVSDHRVSIRMSYEKYLKRDPGLKGKITVRFTITGDGSVTNIQILENTTGNTDLEAEIVRKVKMWSFDAVGEGDVTVTYPFVFSPSQ